MFQIYLAGSAVSHAHDGVEMSAVTNTEVSRLSPLMYHFNCRIRLRTCDCRKSMHVYCQMRRAEVCRVNNITGHIVFFHSYPLNYGTVFKFINIHRPARAIYMDGNMAYSPWLWQICVTCKMHVECGNNMFVLSLGHWKALVQFTLGLVNA